MALESLGKLCLLLFSSKRKQQLMDTCAALSPDLTELNGVSLSQIVLYVLA